MKQTILVVDDEPDAVELICFNLKAAGFNVATAAWALPGGVGGTVRRGGGIGGGNGGQRNPTPCRGGPGAAAKPNPPSEACATWENPGPTQTRGRSMSPGPGGKKAPPRPPFFW